MPILRLLYIILLSLPAVALPAVGFGAEWMSHPAPDDSSSVWFRRTFTGSGRPLRASVSVATTGRFVLYVNGRNVSTALHMPHRVQGDTSAVSVEFDVTRFLRRDTNVVAVLYSPASSARRQIGVAWWGVDSSGARFALAGADGWMCRRGGSCLSGCGETVDGTVDDVSWSHCDMAVPLWQPAAAVGTGRGFLPVASAGCSAESVVGYATHGYNAFADSAVRVQSVLVPRFFDVVPCGVTYDFSPGFCGSVRLTLRGCRRGERIRVGDTVYTCRGEMDEQLLCRFATAYMRRVTVVGDSRFSPEQIQSAEAVNVVY